MKVELNQSELELAARVGAERYIAHALKGRAPLEPYQIAGEGWARHIEGAAGEIAAAKALRLYYPPSVGYGYADGDLAAGLQVRTSVKRELKVRERDADGHVFILVHGEAPKFELLGWLRARHAKQEQYRHAHRSRGLGQAVYYVPAAALWPMESFVRKMREKLVERLAGGAEREREAA